MVKDSHVLGIFSVFVAAALGMTWYVVSGPTSASGAFFGTVALKPMTAIMSSVFIIGVLFIALALIGRENER